MTFVSVGVVNSSIEICGSYNWGVNFLRESGCVPFRPCGHGSWNIFCPLNLFRWSILKNKHTKTPHIFSLLLDTIQLGQISQKLWYSWPISMLECGPSLPLWSWFLPHGPSKGHCDGTSHCQAAAASSASSLYSPLGLLLLLYGPCFWKALVPVKLLLPGFPIFPPPGISQVSPSSSTLSVLSQQIEKLTPRGQEGKDNDSSKLNVFFGHRHTWVVKQ